MQHCIKGWGWWSIPLAVAAEGCGWCNTALRGGAEAVALLVGVGLGPALWGWGWGSCSMYCMVHGARGEAGAWSKG